MYVASHDMEKSVDHLRLQLRSNTTNHAEVEKGQVPTIHHQQISGVRIGMKKSVFKQLLQISAHQQAIYFYR